MKYFVKWLAMLSILLLIINCHPDPCEVDHTIIDGECIPDYIYPNPNLNSGARFYHRTYGVVFFENGKWYDHNNFPIAELELKNN